MDEEQTGTPQGEGLGLRNAALTFANPNNQELSPSEVLDAGCACEGWGIGNAQWHGQFTAHGGATNLSVRSFGVDSTGGVVSAVDMGPLVITHRFTSSGDSRLMKIQVSVSNLSASRVDNVHYRRVFDWDVSPVPFSEVLNFGRMPGADDSYVRFVSDDGFGNPDPQLAPTYLMASDYFSDLGPEDGGGQIDLLVGDLAPYETKSLNLYYGVAADRTDALSAIQNVNAQVYSLAQASVYSPELDSMIIQPGTAIFGVDGSELGVQSGSRLAGEQGQWIFQRCWNIACKAR